MLFLHTLALKALETVIFQLSGFTRDVDWALAQLILYLLWCLCKDWAIERCYINAGPPFTTLDDIKPKKEWHIVYAGTLEWCHFHLGTSSQIETFNNALLSNNAYVKSEKWANIVSQIHWKVPSPFHNFINVAYIVKRCRRWDLYLIFNL